MTDEHAMRTLPRPDYRRGDVRLYRGDCREVLATFPEAFVATVITDPPYGLQFMGKGWDHGVPGVEFWTAISRVCLPGAMLLSFGGTRTFHRLVCAIEDAGWEVRDTLMWLYGSGFPKSLDVSKAIDKAAGAERELGPKRISADGTIAHDRSGARHEGYERPWRADPQAVDRNTRVSYPATEAAKLWDGWGSALKPSYEPCTLAMKPLDGSFAANALKHGVAGLNIDGGRIEGTPLEAHDATGLARDKFFTQGPAKVIHKEPHNLGRWPSNLIHDGSPEVVEGFPEEQQSRSARLGKRGGSGFGYFDDEKSAAATGFWPADSGGSAARFFYCAKASPAERGKGNRHPTVKPLALMRYLAKLTRTPTGGLVLDPFLGSGTTAVACVHENRPCIGIELEQESFDTACRRVDAAFDEYGLLE